MTRARAADIGRCNERRFVGKIVASKDGRASEKRLFPHERAQRVALVRSLRSDLRDRFSALQLQTKVGREFLRKAQRRRLEFMAAPIVNGDSQRFALDLKPGMLRSEHRRSVYGFIHTGRTICAMEDAAAATLKTVHAGEHFDAAFEYPVEVFDGASENDGETAAERRQQAVQDFVAPGFGSDEPWILHERRERAVSSGT